MIKFYRYGTTDLANLRGVLIAIHEDAYADAMEDPFNQRFPWFVDHWGSKPKFSCVVAYDGDTPAGFCYGAPATADREWWREHWTPPQGSDTSTFAVSELMIRPKWRKIGLSFQLHEQLLAGRPEVFSVLLVDVTHPKVKKLYETWGYECVGSRQPFADSPLYAVMLRQLRSA